MIEEKELMSSKLDGYQSQTLSIINEANILEDKDLEIISSLKNELNDTFLHTQMFRTRTEMEVSVLNDIHFPTPDSKYWQSMREQNVHFNELVMLSYEYRKNIIEIKKLQRDMDKEEDELEKELLKIEIDKKMFIQKQQERVAKERIREIQQWHEIKANLIPNLNYSLVDVDQHQIVSYSVKFIKEAMGVGPNTPPADKNNLIGKMLTVCRVCQEKEFWKLVVDQLNNNEKTFIKQFGVNLWQ